VQDDLLDLTPEKGRGGKIGSDIEEGKASILYAHALQAASPEERHKLIHIMSLPRKSTTPEDVQWVIQLYRQCGSLDFARRFSMKLLEQAQAEIRALPLVEEELLTALTTHVIERRTS
jgi:geranylgeranyl pyrophosphate synthase